jgi:hypothetical protein
MKKITLLLLLLCALPIAALREGGHRTSDGIAGSGIAFLLPKADADFSDLDVRDTQNNRVVSPSASQELETLFRENLLQLTVFANTHIMVQVFSWLDTYSHLFNKLILMRVTVVFRLIQEAILPATRRFVHNVHNLCTTFSFGMLAGCFLLSAIALQKTPRNIHLRC